MNAVINKIFTGGEENPLVLEFECFEKPVLVVDHYCTNPLCICTDFLLLFYELSGSECKGELLSFRLDIGTWEVAAERFERRKDLGEKIIKEFRSGLDNSLKDMFLSRFKSAKKLGKQNPLESIKPSMITDSKCFAYTEVFDEDNSVFMYKGAKYIVIDHYCMNPDCICNEAVLEFINIIPERKEQKAKFAVRLKLDELKYTIEFNNTTQKELDEISQYYLNTCKDRITAYRNHYRKMKELGKKILQKHGIIESRSIDTIDKVGRNDLCPCGSGKKYKKCCGS